jgi:restriction endonuclease Mrr
VTPNSGSIRLCRISECSTAGHDHFIEGVTEVSKAGLQQVVSAMADETFRRRVKENPDSALASYDLTPDEKAAIKSGNAAKLHELGVDERVTKSIVFDEEKGHAG